MEGSGLDFT
jgi:tetratricopeptide (TPR) repeat protein